MKKILSYYTGRPLGSVETKNGKKVLRDFSGKPLGTFDGKTTRDFSGRIKGFGDQLSSFLDD